ncbi:MAG: threonine aldolase family protein [Rhodothalassiaceae bacterium]
MAFWSDNCAPVAPEILAALADANRGPAPAYGADAWTDQLPAAFGQVFGTEVAVFPIATGTAANCLGIAHLSPPWGAVLAHETAHLLEDESTAPELIGGGARLVGLPGALGKVDPDGLARWLEAAPWGFVHAPQPALLALTQATELGTVYSVEEVQAVCAIARRFGLATMMDGARFANAVAHLGCDPAEITVAAGLDMLVFGATKNAALTAEAAIFFDPARAEAFGYRRKRAAHLLSKMRYVSAQLLASLDQDRWLSWAQHANAMARSLAARLAQVPGVTLCHEPQANAMFARLPEALVERLSDAAVGFYPWPSLGPDAYRFVTAWNTEPADIDQAISALRP